MTDTKIKIAHIIVKLIHSSFRSKSNIVQKHYTLANITFTKI